MPSSKSLKCASCAKKGIKCVDVSWGSLDKTRESTKAQLNKDLEELEKIMARISRNRKVLAQAEARAKTKTICLLEELEEEEQEERKVNGGLSNGELAEASNDLSVFLGSIETSGMEDWNALGIPNGSPVELGESSTSAT